MSEWQPIETAPSGIISEDPPPPRIMFWVEDGGDDRKGCHAFGRVYDGHGGKIVNAEGFLGAWVIKKWMPLPAPPGEQE